MHKPATSQVPIHEIIANRWSGRAYDASQVISQTHIIAMLEAARWAPSCYGDQPWRFVLCNKSADLAAWQQAFECLAPSNQAWAKDAPALILACANTLFNHNQQPNRWAQYDTGAAVENLCLQASSMGLMTHQMGGFNAELSREKFNIPVQFTPMVMISVGVAAEIATLSGDILARETAPRSRRLLSELVFSGAWGQGID